MKALRWPERARWRYLRAALLSVAVSAGPPGVLFPAVVSGGLAAQTPTTLTLPPPDAVVASDPFGEAGFTWITSVRELSRDRVLVADYRENRLSLVELSSSRVEQVGSAGDGPGEFRWVGWLYPLGGDSTLVTDAATRRWTVLRGTEPVGVLPATDGPPRWFDPVFGGADREGRVLGTRPHPAAGRMEEAERLVLLLGTLGSTSMDTLAVIAGGGEFGRRVVQRGGSGQGALIAEHPFLTWDQAVLAADGWVAVVRAHPYRVDWRTPSGTWVRGDEVGEPPTPLEERLRCRFLEAVYGRCAGAPSFDWPDALPPFLRQTPNWTTAPATATVFPTPDERLLVRRTPVPDAEANRYDLFDRTGARVGVLSVPPNVAVVGFGAGSVYTVLTDEWELQTLRRHPWP